MFDDGSLLYLKYTKNIDSIREHLLMWKNNSVYIDSLKNNYISPNQLEYYLNNWEIYCNNNELSTEELSSKLDQFYDIIINGVADAFTINHDNHLELHELEEIRDYYYFLLDSKLFDEWYVDSQIAFISTADSLFPLLGARLGLSLFSTIFNHPEIYKGLIEMAHNQLFLTFEDLKGESSFLYTTNKIHSSVTVGGGYVEVVSIPVADSLPFDEYVDSSGIESKSSNENCENLPEARIVRARLN